jgi:hypothetical protein
MKKKTIVFYENLANINVKIIRHLANNAVFTPSKKMFFNDSAPQATF